jgi:hypothetical protein
MAATEQAAADRTPDGIVAIGAGREPPKTNLAANRLRGITHVHQFGTFPTFDPLPETKLLHPADDKLAGEPPAQQPI